MIIMNLLKDKHTNPPTGFESEYIEKQTNRLKEKLSELQNVLYAEKKNSLLIVLQGMDASGKDGTIKHVFSSVNLMGISVKSFKAPTEEEAAHDFLWRVHPHTPAKGQIQLFNRSHYEDILFPSVHETIDKKSLKKRYDLINSFEENLTLNNTTILKFFLHISKEEQKKRIEARLTTPHKKWKYAMADTIEGTHWNAYMKTYEKIIERCSPEIPWCVVPADNKEYRNYLIAKEIVNALTSLKMKYPTAINNNPQ
jgi:PPK2 family polyphosphate:nucleotide phosphotransferase